MDTAKLVRAKMFLNRRKDMEHKELADIAKILNKMADDLRVANEKMDRVERTAREESTSAAFLVRTVLGDRND